VILSVRKNILVSAGAFFLVFLVSFVVFLIEGRSRMNSIIFFPEPVLEGVTGEPRRLPRQKTPEGNARLLINEMILGPMDIRHTNIFPHNTRLRSVFIRHETAYLDFSPDIIFLDSKMRLSFDELVSAIRQTVLFNFRQLSHVVITVNGQIPGVASYLPPGGGK